MRESIQIAIDGPAGSGKSTLAKALAQHYGYVYIDTGAMYRAITYFFLQNHVPAENEAVGPWMPKVHIELLPDGSVWLNGEDVSKLIRTEHVSGKVSAYAKLPAVRQGLSAMQRAIAEKDNVVMDGRDIGSVILPKAQHKFYLTASPLARAERRYKEYLLRGEKSESLEAILESIKMRDKDDMEREESPLIQTEDALCIETDNLSIDEVFERMRTAIEKRK